MDEFLRIYLLSGLVVHKAVWEILKVRPEAKNEQNGKPGLNLPFLMKTAKIMLLMLLILQTIFMAPVFPISENPEWIIRIGIFFYTLGLILAITGRIQLGSSWSNIEESKRTVENKLIDRGIYRFIRHPIYTGDAMLVLGLELALNSWFFLIIFPLMGVIINRARNEERVLAQSIPEYSTYQKHSKMFLPFIV